MPGIAGILSKTQQKRNEKNLNQMIDSMMHEPFYSSGTYVNNQFGLYVGWVQQRDSFSDCMPIFNSRKNMILIFYGENFIDYNILEQLKAKYHKFNSFNASYLIHLYEEYGINFLLNLNGWFCGLLIDLFKKEVFLFNDRFGMQRLYYFENKETFYFSSEAKSLLMIFPELRNIDDKSLGEYLCFNCVFENRTLYKNIFILPGGAFWKFKNKSLVEKGNYFNREIWERQPLLENEVFFQKLKAEMNRILPRYFSSRQAIGISLTGGLDSRLIMAHLNQISDRSPCYTFSGIYRDNYDTLIAQRIAKYNDQVHHIIRLDKNFLVNFPWYAEKTIYISDGYMNITGAPDLFLNKFAREIAPIRMTGNHGSEIIRNVQNIKSVPFPKKLFDPDLEKKIQDAKSTLEKIKSETLPLSFAIFYEAPLIEYNRLVIEQSQLILRTPYMDNDIIALMYSAPTKARASNEIMLRLINETNPALNQIITDRGIKGRFFSPGSFLIHLYYEFFFKLEYLFNYGMPQWFAMISYPINSIQIERFFLGRHKFHHFRVWLREELANYVKEILLDSRTLDRPYLNKKLLQNMVKKHLKGYGNYTNEIILLLSLELIQRLLIEKQY